jgi:hypothetical protein
MDVLSDVWDTAADTLNTAGRSLPLLAAPADAFGADDAGRPGRLGRDLHAHWAAVLDARAHEAADTAARLAGTAQALRLAHQRYTETDDLAARRLRREA